MKKHAYLILAHKNPEQVKTLLHLLDDPRNDIYIHVDKKAGFGYDILEGTCKNSGLHFIEPRIQVHWGGISIINVEMALLEEAVKAEHSYYHLLSGMDLPLKSQDTIHQFFTDNDGKEFLNIWAMEDHTKRRVQYYTPFPEGGSFFLTNHWNHVVKGILKVMGIKMNKDIEFKIGSQWFSITDSLAKYIVSQKEWVHKVFKHSYMCDEIFIPTLVWRSPYRNNLYCQRPTEGHEIDLSNMRFIDWSRGASRRHPWTFTIDDYELLMSVPHFWARKFDEEVDNDIILKIAGTDLP